MIDSDQVWDAFGSIVGECHYASVRKGWWEGLRLLPIEVPHGSPFRDMVGSKLMLIVTEVAEAMEELRISDDITTGHLRVDGKPDGFPSELADVVIRCFDLAGYLNIDLAAEIRSKMAYNETREHRHGGKHL
jgi:NTP pyrophosphatase (non-canonical NTP hydrolase)